MEFLDETGRMRWLEAEKNIIIFKAKGKMIADSLEYLVDRHVRAEHHRRVRKYEAELKRITATEAKQRKIEDFM